MARKTKKHISSYYGNDSKTDGELMIREAFLRTAKETLDCSGIEDYSIEQIRGGLMMLEKFKEIREEN